MHAMADPVVRGLLKTAGVRYDHERQPAGRFAEYDRLAKITKAASRTNGALATRVPSCMLLPALPRVNRTSRLHPAIRHEEKLRFGLGGKLGRP